MRDNRFFEGIPQHQISWEHGETFTPTFFYDTAQLSVVFVTPLDRIRELLPSDQLHPLRITPRSALTVISAYKYRDCDIGPYNEVLVGFPVSVHKRAPVLAGLRRFMAKGGAIWIWQLPVTTEIARDLGVSIAGYPKFLADIEFGSEAGIATCRLREGDRDILSLRVKHGRPRQAGIRMRYEPVTVKDDHLLRSIAVSNYPHATRSFSGRTATLELGDHPLADQIRRLSPGRVLMVSYAPDSQVILTSPFESWPLAEKLAPASGAKRRHAPTLKTPGGQIEASGLIH
jgi:hypothetical protein